MATIKNILEYKPSLTSRMMEENGVTLEMMKKSISSVVGGALTSLLPSERISSLVPRRRLPSWHRTGKKIDYSFHLEEEWNFKEDPTITTRILAHLGDKEQRLIQHCDSQALKCLCVRFTCEFCSACIWAAKIFKQAVLLPKGYSHVPREARTKVESGAASDTSFSVSQERTRIVGNQLPLRAYLMRMKGAVLPTPTDAWVVHAEDFETIISAS
ncbi:hypothetical protein VNO77_02607 [Canavalia gladiata]|uniref:Uncharacterized protein n=1 Tax=Canavalia gladiata TaxID=3824 RepID=A0AAN9MTC1_CANGL